MASPHVPGHPLLSRRSVLLAAAASATAAAGCSAEPDEADVPTTPSSSSPAPPSDTGDAAVPPSDVVLDDATRSRLDVLFDDGFSGTGVAGLAGALWIGEDSWSRVAGVKDLTTREPFSLDDRFRCASITKSFCGTAVLQLVDAGELSLDDRLETFVPGIAGGDRITLEMMLGMRSGLYDFTSDAAFLAAFDADPAMPWTDRQTIDIIRAGTPAFEPGAKVVYADSNFALLGVVLSQVTGRPAGEVITDGIIDPLGLTATSYPTSAAMPEPHPTGYVPVLAGGDPDAPFDNVAAPPRVVNEVNPAVPSTAGAMVSSVDDLRAWAQELADGTLLSPRTQQRRLAASRRLDGQQVNLGYGLGVLTLNEFLGHDGAIYGYSSIVLRRPQTDTTIVLAANESTNSTTPTFGIAFSMIAALYPDQVS